MTKKERKQMIYILGEAKQLIRSEGEVFICSAIERVAKQKRLGYIGDILIKWIDNQLDADYNLEEWVEKHYPTKYKEAFHSTKWGEIRKNTRVNWINAMIKELQND